MPILSAYMYVRLPSILHNRAMPVRVLTAQYTGDWAGFYRAFHAHELAYWLRSLRLSRATSFSLDCDAAAQQGGQRSPTSSACS